MLNVHLLLTCVILTQVTSTAFASTTPDVEVEQVCEGETFKATCAQPDQVLFVQSAQYGRMSASRCLVPAATDCRLDVLAHLDRTCSGRQSCELKVSVVTDAVGVLQLPVCLRHARGYLEVTYTCLTVVRPPTQCTCPSESSPVSLPGGVQQSGGYISSNVARETGCGGVNCPWLVRLQPGQHLTLTLFDFAALSRDPALFELDTPRVCQVYAIIKDRGAAARPVETVCGKADRQSHAFQSLSNEVEIRLTAVGDFHFVIKYDVDGCVDPVAPVNGWVRRSQDKAMFGCNGTSVVWQKTCKDKRWTGDNTNCSALPAAGQEEWTVMQSGASRQIVQLFTENEWLTVVVIIFIALLIGVLIFTLGFLVIKRRRVTSSRYHHQPGLQPGYAVPPYQDYHSADYVSKTGGLLPPAPENDYFRTWQLQRHAMASSTSSTPSTPSAYNASQLHRDRPLPPQPLPTVFPSHYHHHVEHIYESPKFERRAHSLRRMPSAGSSVRPQLSFHCFDMDIDEPPVVTGRQLQRDCDDSLDVARRHDIRTLASFGSGKPT